MYSFLEGVGNKGHQIILHSFMLKDQMTKQFVLPKQKFPLPKILKGNTSVVHTAHPSGTHPECVL